MRDRATTAIAALSAAFRNRDVQAALACFADHRDATYIGSEQGELAVGRNALSKLLERVFARDEAYSWAIDHSWSSECGDVCMVVAELTGTVHRDSGGTERFAYVLSGVLSIENDTGRWLLCHGAEPTT